MPLQGTGGKRSQFLLLSQESHNFFTVDQIIYRQKMLEANNHYYAASSLLNGRSYLICEPLAYLGKKDKTSRSLPSLRPSLGSDDGCAGSTFRPQDQSTFGDVFRVTN